jgi:predicted esterase
MPYLKAFTFLLIASIVCDDVIAQQTAQKFVYETHYLLSLPVGYDTDSTRKWPLVMFLHGSGESGTDLQKVKAHGPPEMVEKGRKFPFILVSPQNEIPSGWNTDRLYELLLHVRKMYRVDEKRIYLTGLSMGGFGTWDLAIKHPEEFAAIAPVCGGGDTTNSWKLRHMPIWCFHGAKDDVVPPAGSQNMVRSISRYNNNVRFTLYPNANHNSWDITYNNDSLYSWLLSQKKFQFENKTTNASSLKNLEGFYIGPDKDTVQILVKNDSLIAKPGNQIVPLYAAENNVFFIRPDRLMDIRFTKTGNVVNGFEFMGDRKLLYRKIQKIKNK